MPAPIPIDSPGPSKVRSHPQLRSTAPVPSAAHSTSFSDRDGFLSRPRGRPHSLYPSARGVSGSDHDGGLRPPSWARPRAKPEADDNWRLLREMVEGDDEGEDGSMLPRSASSYSTIRSHRSISSATTIRPRPVAADAESNITGQISSSPPAMSGLEEFYRPPQTSARGIEEVLEEPQRILEEPQRIAERRPLLPRNPSANRVPKASPPVGTFCAQPS